MEALPASERDSAKRYEGHFQEALFRVLTLRVSLWSSLSSARAAGPYNSEKTGGQGRRSADVMSSGVPLGMPRLMAAPPRAFAQGPAPNSSVTARAGRGRLPVSLLVGRRLLDEWHCVGLSPVADRWRVPMDASPVLRQVAGIPWPNNAEVGREGVGYTPI